MVSLGIDVTIMAAFGILLVMASCVMASLLPMSQEQGDAVVIATAMTALAMVLAYIVMAYVLDAMVGCMGW